MDNTDRTTGTPRTGRLTDKVNVMARGIEECTKSTRQDPTRRQAKRAAHTKADKALYHETVGCAVAWGRPTSASRKVDQRKAAHRRFLRSREWGL